MFEISREPFSPPVTAVIVTQPEMSVPELVMNCLAPSITHSPSSSFARSGVARVGARLGLGEAEGGEALAAHSVGIHSDFCSSVPHRWIGIVPSDVWAASVMHTDESIRASSSTARA